MGWERILITIKPDAVKRGLVGEIIKHFEDKGLVVSELKMMNMNRELAIEFYAEHKRKPFFNELITYITSGSIVVMIMEGEGCVSRAREIVGETDPLEAAEGTIRKLYAISLQQNAVHASDSPLSASREIDCLFRSYLDFQKRAA